MILDMTQAIQREVYYTGRFYENDVPNLIWQVVREGDAFIDIGANVGHISLFAARRIGRNGRIIAFEPNPCTRAFLWMHKVANDLDMLEIREEAIGDCDATAELHLNPTNRGECTLRSISGSHTMRVPMIRGAILDTQLEQMRPAIVKIDVEGYEYRVLKGLGPFLERRELLVVLEMTDCWLRDLGGSAQELVRFMEVRGFTCLTVRCCRSIRRPNELSLLPLAECTGRDSQMNVCFVREGTRMHARVVPFIKHARPTKLPGEAMPS
ncbi:MAG: FkbM family methyltransferase [Planctomycetota bacterium]|nr:FkbM family methyltransferase [Planctomycetota bacterium]